MPNDDFYVFGLSRYTVFNLTSIYVQEYTYKNNIIQGTFSTMAAFEGLSLVFLALLLISIVVFFIRRHDEIFQSLVFVSSICMLLCQIIAFHIVFSVTGNLNDQHFANCQSKYYCETFRGSADGYIWGPLKGLWLGLAALCVSFVNAIVCAIFKWTRYANQAEPGSKLSAVSSTSSSYRG
ncbi:hypothetical protein SAMD00019534_045720 [Acytostelium subglobosum LB1]|uniref:hypothetical protein n=1 Tax=Acytostelium subglobosum LB1 TaxID=1410327 RepID=UPI00064481AB|nr:hypothetical protein SAMD00019534_045720 [Acytostelium subglobosum LB1]GAM21397.1 hypothetical protein SAMD00019534_045720 [Acytostelium subglobosum LB1]|eukprot:XP_012755516.1 hypothetical protein SAMD00019534_045720 [Acytostelium subglobosum LB1]